MTKQLHEIFNITKPQSNGKRIQSGEVRLAVRNEKRHPDYRILDFSMDAKLVRDAGLRDQDFVTMHFSDDLSSVTLKGSREHSTGAFRLGYGSAGKGKQSRTYMRVCFRYNLNFLPMFSKTKVVVMSTGDSALTVALPTKLGEVLRQQAA